MLRRLVEAASGSRSLSQKALQVVLRRIIPRSQLSLMEQVALKVLPRPQYAYTAVRASELAVRLGYKEVTWIEFGVANGNGLVALETIKAEVERQLPVRVRIVGFDMGSGLPSPVDYRDLPYFWSGGFYAMDVPALKARLTSSTLMLGPVAETLATFLENPPVNAPVGMVVFDLDYYSSTVAAFEIFQSSPDGAILPRVMCVFDDIVGTQQMYSDFTGERLAIRELNERDAARKISPCYDFGEFGYQRWQEQVMIYHNFDHRRYTEYVGHENMDRQMKLAP